jgi:hypothetical protein
LPAEISRFETRKLQLYKKKLVRNIKNKVSPKDVTRPKSSTKKESKLKKPMMNSPEEPYIGNSKQMLQQKT